MPRSDSDYDNQWRRLRREVLRYYPDCRVCGAKASMVDHITPISKGGARMDPANLQALCWKCHVRVTNSFDRNKMPPGGCDAEGRPLNRKHPWAVLGELGYAPPDPKRNWVRTILDGKTKKR